MLGLALLRRLKLGICVLLLSAMPIAVAQEDEVLLRWASSGGGWRSMTSNFGFANAFVKAGLIDPATSSSEFSAISANSGGTWFLTQFVYSSAFFDRVVSTNEGSVRQFAIEWLSSYQNFMNDANKESFFCRTVSPFGLVAILDDFSNLCSLFVPRKDGWAYFIDGMLRKAASDYGDPDFGDTAVNSENRVPTFADTDIFFQTTLAANSRFNARSFFRPFGQDVSYVGPSDSNEVYAVSVGVQWAIKEASSSFRWAAEPSSLPLSTTTARGPRGFQFEDWDGFHLYDDREEGNLIANIELPESASRKVLSDPFDGMPTTTQISAASSATNAHLSGKVPSFLAQRASIEASTGTIGFFAKVRTYIESASTFVSPFMYGFSVCTQWPNDCGASDGQFLDGGFSDGPTLAMNVGQYQTVDNGDIGKTMKVIVTDNNFFTDTNVKFLSYFETTFNEGIDPGEYVWAPFTVAESFPTQVAPWRSQQIFEEYLEEENLIAEQQPISSTSAVTTATFTATTVDNSAFGVVAGQTVEILLIQTNSNVPTVMVQGRQIREFSPALADLAAEISDSDTLVDRIKAFVAM